METNSTRLFERLEVLDDLPPHSGALNMALDETLLVGLGDTPLLRIYRWDRPTVSFGYFERWQALTTQYSGQPLVRRWTGGGAVAHGEDVTYSLLLPRSHPLTNLRAGESYRLIHLAVRSALEVAGWHEPALSPATEKLAAESLRDCFREPVQHDLLQAGRKIGGAAQRRTRAGLLHQGSVRLPERTPEQMALFATTLPGALTGRGAPRELRADELARALSLASTRYAADEWLRQR